MATFRVDIFECVTSEKEEKEKIVIFAHRIAFLAANGFRLYRAFADAYYPPQRRTHCAKSKNSSKSSEHSISPSTLPQKSNTHHTIISSSSNIPSPSSGHIFSPISHHTNNSFTSQNTNGKSRQKWLDEMVQQRRLKFIPYEEFEDERIEEKSESGITSFIKTVQWKKMRKRVVVKELEYVEDLSEETREAFVNEHSRNILFQQSYPKLSDFGICSHVFYSSVIYAHTEPRFIPYTDPQYLREPNIYTKNTKSDIYSLGVILWEISSGRIPFSSYSNRNNYNDNDRMGIQMIGGGIGEKISLERERSSERSNKSYTGKDKRSISSDNTSNTLERSEELINRILKGVREQAVKDTPNGYYGIYNKCWQTEPNIRPTIEVVIKELNILLENNGKLMKKMSRGGEWGIRFGEFDKGKIIEIVETTGNSLDSDDNILQEILNEENEVINEEGDVINEEDEVINEDNKPKLNAKNKPLESMNSRKDNESMSESSEEGDNELDDENLPSGWTLINSVDYDDFDNYDDLPMNGTNTFDNVNVIHPVIRDDDSIKDQTNKYVYGNRCKMLFNNNRWTLQSQKCFAAYHARVGDFEGIRWHVKNDGKEILDNVQEISGPRNSYRRPLEALVIEATMYCPAHILLPTYTYLLNLGANIHSIDSYTSGTCINFLACNTSLLSDLIPRSSSSNGYYFKQCLKFLLAKGLDINSQTITGDTLLNSLIFKWHPYLTPDIIEFVIQNGANPNLANNRIGTPLGYTLLATRFDDNSGPFKKVYKILKILIENGGNINQETVIPGRKLKNLLWILVDININLKIDEQKKILELLLKWGIDVGKLNEREQESGIFGNELFNENKENNEENNDIVEMITDDEKYIDDNELLLYDDPIETTSSDEFVTGSGVGGFGRIEDENILEIKSQHARTDSNISRLARTDSSSSTNFKSSSNSSKPTTMTTMNTRKSPTSLKFITPDTQNSTPKYISTKDNSKSYSKPRSTTLKFPSSPVKQTSKLTAQDIPLSILKPYLRTSSQSTISPTSPTSDYTSSNFLIEQNIQNIPEIKTSFIPNKPLNVLVYAVQLNRYDMVKILLERIYELSERESILAALKECGVTNQEKITGSERINIIPGFLRRRGSHNGYSGHSEIKNYLLTWIDNNEKRKRVLLRSEKAQLKWKRKNENEHQWEHQWQQQLSKGKITDHEEQRKSLDDERQPEIKVDIKGKSKSVIN
ncbi:5058_t:CDS:10 [Diversispora eburnea]|uniref:5058_t:CDS:1 n=1 Tax=Diversispora eburnea TaxID=1213867 RepID=A0A9N9F198_9GLOM|nr:5058_t:CDS:10 [Diversispora eburnea]